MHKLVTVSYPRIPVVVLDLDKTLICALMGDHPEPNQYDVLYRPGVEQFLQRLVDLQTEGRIRLALFTTGLDIHQKFTCETYDRGENPLRRFFVSDDPEHLPPIRCVLSRNDSFSQRIGRKQFFLKSIECCRARIANDLGVDVGSPMVFLDDSDDVGAVNPRSWVFIPPFEAEFIHSSEIATLDDAYCRILDRISVLETSPDSLPANVSPEEIEAFFESPEKTRAFFLRRLETVMNQAQIELQAESLNDHMIYHLLSVLDKFDPKLMSDWDEPGVFTQQQARIGDLVDSCIDHGHRMLATLRRPDQIRYYLSGIQILKETLLAHPLEVTVLEPQVNKLIDFFLRERDVFQAAPEHLAALDACFVGFLADVIACGVGHISDSGDGYEQHVNRVLDRINTFVWPTSNQYLPILKALPRLTELPNVAEARKEAIVVYDMVYLIATVVAIPPSEGAVTAYQDVLLENLADLVGVLDPIAPDRLPSQDQFAARIIPLWQLLIAVLDVVEAHLPDDDDGWGNMRRLIEYVRNDTDHFRELKAAVSAAQAPVSSSDPSVPAESPEPPEPEPVATDNGCCSCAIS